MQGAHYGVPLGSTSGERRQKQDWAREQGAMTDPRTALTHPTGNSVATVALQSCQGWATMARSLYPQLVSHRLWAAWGLRCNLGTLRD